jgi:signal peptidase II
METDSRQAHEAPTTDVKGDDISRWPDPGAHLIYWSIVVIGVAADLWSKWAIFRWLKPDEQHTVIEGYFRIVRWVNDGAAFGIGEGQTVMLVTISAVALVVVAGIFIFGRIHSRLMQVALGLFTAGIMGNLYDRAFNNGGVRDFIDTTIPVINYRWPAFNVADSMLCIAVGLLLIGNITSAFSQKHADEQK